MVAAGVQKGSGYPSGQWLGPAGPGGRAGSPEEPDRSQARGLSFSEVADIHAEIHLGVGLQLWG